jgi:hypothetical protein
VGQTQWNTRSARQVEHPLEQAGIDLLIALLRMPLAQSLPHHRHAQVVKLACGSEAIAGLFG